MILWNGKSKIDGSPIVLIATGIDKAKKSKNDKTGAMVQTWILRADMHPSEAIAQGSDFSICGDCPHRGHVNEKTGKRTRSCYVNIMGPASVYRSFVKGNYGPANWEALRGLPIRFGSYGDPAAVPVAIWRKLKALATRTTGYTHQWHKRAGKALQGLVMASCDTPMERVEAIANGWRVFEIIDDITQLADGSISCPASEEAGKRTTCERCGLCDGRKTVDDARKNIGIMIHNPSGKKYFKFNVLQGKTA